MSILGAVNFKINKPIIVTTNSEKEKVEDVIEKEVGLIDQMIKLVEVSDIIENLLQQLGELDLEDKIRDQIYAAIYSYIHAGETSVKGNEKQKEKRVSKIVVAVLESLSSLNLSEERTSQIRTALYAVLGFNNTDIWNVLSRNVGKSKKQKITMAEAQLVGWAIYIAEVATYGKEKYDEFISNLDKAIDILTTKINAHVKDIYKEKKLKGALKTLQNKELPNMEQNLAKSLRPQTLKRIEEAKKSRCDGEGKNCQETSKSKLTINALIYVKNQLKTELNEKENGYEPPPLPPIEDPTNDSLSNLDYWMQRNKVDLYIKAGGGYKGILGVDTQLIGKPDTNAVLDAELGIEKDFDLGKDNTLTLKAYGSGEYQGNFGYESNPNFGTIDGGALVKLQNQFPHWYTLGVKGGYLHQWNDIPVLTPSSAYLDGGHGYFDVYGSIGRYVFADLGYGFELGEHNALEWTKHHLKAGLKLNVPSFSLYAGYSGAFEKYSGYLDEFNAAHGMYFGTDILAGRHNISIAGRSDIKPAWKHIEAELDAKYKLRLKKFDIVAGLEYKREDIYNGVNDSLLFGVGFEKIALKESKSGKLGLYLDVVAQAGLEELDFDERSPLNDKKGAYLGAKASISLGKKTPTDKGEIKSLMDYDYYPAVQASQIDALMIKDPHFKDLFSEVPDRINKTYINRYLYAWKAGLLKGDYTLDPKKLKKELKKVNLKHKFKEIDSDISKKTGTAQSQKKINTGWYGYEPKFAEFSEVTNEHGTQYKVWKIGLGSAAPLAVRIGAGNPTGLKDNQPEAKKYYKGINVLTKNKRYLLKAASARHWIVKNEKSIEVKASNQGTWLANKLLKAISLLVLDDEIEKIVDPEVGLGEIEEMIDTFVDDLKPGLWDKIENKKYFEGTGAEFKKYLAAELRARVVGHAVMALSRWLLSDVKGVGGLNQLSKEAVDVICVKAFNDRAEMGAELKEPTKEQLEEIIKPLLPAPPEVEEEIVKEEEVAAEEEPEAVPEEEVSAPAAEEKIAEEAPAEEEAPVPAAAPEAGSTEDHEAAGDL